MNPSDRELSATHEASVPSAAGAPFSIRPVRPADVDVLANLVRELAVYEKLEDHARATADDFKRHLFGPHPAAEAALAEVGGEPVGFALWFSTFSTFRGQPGLYLEDIFVRPDHRGRGIGQGLLAMVARLALERGCGRLEWSVLDWNSPAIGFYRALGARPMDDWTVYRVDDEPLRRLAAMAMDRSRSGPIASASSGSPDLAQEIRLNESDRNHPRGSELDERLSAT
jgi:GNAT superfamily N-acetyltransferase